MTVAKIWRQIPEQYNMLGKRCPACDGYYFPAREVCKTCGNTELEDYTFSGKGKIVTFTVIRTPVSDPEHENIEIASRNVPYILAIIKLEEGPMITGQVVDCEIDEVSIGKNVGMVFRKIQEYGEKGVIQYGYKFRFA